MEFTFKIIVTMVIILIAVLVFATIMTEWGTKATGWAEIIIDPIRNLIFGK